MAPKQDDIPGVEGEGVSLKKIRRLDDAIDAWREAVEKRMKLSLTEIEKRDRVLTIMHEEGLSRYRWTDDRNVVLKDGVKVEKIKTAKNGDEDE